ncbi:MAG: error-prone DNA polymerase [Thiohalobacteraceae bacterium]
MQTAYAELHCLSNFSFLRGASHPDELVERAAQLGYRALAITDECSLAGVVRAHMAAKAVGLDLIIGSEIRLADGPRLVLLATNRNGYGNLSELITRGRRAAVKGRYQLQCADLADGLPDCLALLIPDAETRPADLCWLRDRFPGRTWLGVELVRGADDDRWLENIRALGAATRIPLVACGDVHMHCRARHLLQDTLTAVRLGTPVAELGTQLQPNGERHLRSLERLAAIYPVELLLETVRIAARCTFSLDELRYEYPEEIVAVGETPSSYLRKLTEAGLRQRYPDGAPTAVVALAEKELQLIAELAYEPYFLTVYDIVAFARARGILCQGRGSAANSVVCFCLGITEVDPGRMQVLFERFISKERNEPPDIDVDFEHERREEVMQYIFAKYGRDRAAITGAIHTYRPKGALRDVGKALGFSLDQTDRLAKAMSWWDGRRIQPERLREAGFDPDNVKVAQLVALTQQLLGFPRHLSQHSGGFVIDRRKLSRLVPIENAAMPDRTVIQWDKDDLDALGLMKVDVLSLGMLSAIRAALNLINGFRGTGLTLADVPAEDAATYRMIQHADTVGVFQIESRAQMAMLPRLKPRCFYDLVIEVAIVRPGPIQGGMVHPYLRRREGSEPVTYPSPAVKGVLERTLGVSIFQEQVMQLAVVAAGFTPGQADQLRRAMAAWRRRGGLEPFRDQLIAGMLARGYALEFAESIFQQILGFGEYGFPESHAASFALLVYVSAWIKCHEPAAFACALLNSQPMGFYAPDQILQDARRHQVQVRPVDCLHSSWLCTLEDAGDGTPALRLGFCMVKGLRKEAAERLVAARAQRKFRDVADLARRARLNKRDLQALAAADALAGLGGHRRNALWQTLGLEAATPLLADAAAPESPAMLSAPRESEEIVADYAQLGFTLRRHPLALLRAHLKRMRLSSSEDLRQARPGQWLRLAGLVTCRQRPATSSGVTFLTLEDEYGCVNVVVWRDLAERQRRELLGAQLLGVYGQIERQGEVIHLMAKRLDDHSALLGGLRVSARNFH